MVTGFQGIEFYEMNLFYRRIINGQWWCGKLFIPDIWINLRETVYHVQCGDHHVETQSKPLKLFGEDSVSEPMLTINKIIVRLPLEFRTQPE